MKSAMPIRRPVISPLARISPADRITEVSTPGMASADLLLCASERLLKVSVFLGDLCDWFLPAVLYEQRAFGRPRYVRRMSSRMGQLG
jgi:hypothetical protein